MLLSSNLTYVLHNYIGLRKKFWKKRVTGRNDCFHWILIPASSNLNCWAQLYELIPIYQYARTHLKPRNCTWITIFTVKLCKVKFYNPYNPENQNFEKMKKASGDVIILNLCNKKHDQMMYAYSDMECNRHNFLSF